MKKEELIKEAELELQWLKYYANSDSRKVFIPTKSPYDQLVTMGYTKRFIPLHSRCAFLRVTAELPLVDASVEDMVESNNARNPENNILSALEVVLIKYPELHDWVIKSLYPS